MPILEQLLTSTLLKICLTLSLILLSMIPVQFVGSLVIDLLSTITPFEETWIGICTNDLFKNKSIAHGLKNVNSDLLYLTTKESCFLINPLYKQIDRVAASYIVSIGAFTS